MKLPAPGVAALLPTLTLGLSIPPQRQLSLPAIDQSKRPTCPLAPKVSLASVSPSDGDGDGLLPALHILHNATIRETQINRLSRVVQIPTTVTDYMNDPNGPGFEVFEELHALLKDLFPLVHEHAELSHINTHALLYTLPGTNNHLQPLLLLAHQDVVPIDDANDWTYPPFSGHYDGSSVWGRGASDCKNTLIGTLSAVEALLAQGFKPTRTILLAYGFDEESHGFLGAGHLAPELEKRYGKDSIALILDEGGSGLRSLPGDENTVYALPAVGEKGSLDLVFELAVPGGHSSIPPAHTGIGVMAEIIYTLEREDIFEPLLDETHPTRKLLECQVAHSPTHVESWLADTLSSPTTNTTNLAAKLSQTRGAKFAATLVTTQASDLISGGVKSNALPEKISAVVNYRVALHESPTDVISRAVRLVEPIAHKYNLSFDYSDSPEGEGGKGDEINHLGLRPLALPLSPAPISPTTTGQDRVWTRFAGVARSVFESLPALKGKKVVVSGDVMTGNTDTRFYWGLSRNIYRWNPSRGAFGENIHTVNEKQDVTAHLEAMMVYYDLIRAFDQWDDAEDQSHEL